MTGKGREKILGLLFLEAVAILLRMQTAISIVVWAGCALVVMFVALMVIVDMAGKFDYLQTHFPWLIKWSEKRELQGLLLLICVGLLIGLAYEFFTKEVPEIHDLPLVIKAAQPPAITVTKVVSPTQKESPNSLRRRTVKLVDDLTLFWKQRPTPPAAPNPNGTADPDRERVAKWNQYWQETTSAYGDAGFRERILRIVREYKAKGIPIGFLEAAEQPDRLMGSEIYGRIGSPEECARFMSDVCYLRELAYHVDAHDEPIFIQP